MIVGITYGDRVFQNSRERAFNSLKRYTDKSFLFTETDLEVYKEKYSKTEWNFEGKTS